MWTSVVSPNTGQTRFFELAEQEAWMEGAAIYPADGCMVDPASTPGLTSDSRGVNRLLRFDASMAYAMGGMDLIIGTS